MLSKLSNIILKPSIAVDLGTANTRIYTYLHGKVTEMPSSIRPANIKTNNISDEYLQFINNKISTKPLKGGVIVDLENTITLLKPLVRKSRRFMMAPVSLASAPTDTTENERDLICKALMNSGSSHVSIIPEVLVAAIGAGIDVSSKNSQLIVDIGDGVTDMAVFRDGEIIYSSSIRLACSDLQRAVRSEAMTNYKVHIFDDDVEKLTHVIDFLLKKYDCKNNTFNAYGIDILKRCKVNVKIKKIDIVNAIEPVINKIIEMIDGTLKKLPEKIYCEILESGICLTGGGACIEGIDRLIAHRTKLDVRIASDPMHAVINGAIATLNYWNGKRFWWRNIVWPNLST